MTDHDASADYDRPATGVRTPWKMPVHNSVLIAGLRAIVADALSREDYHTASYACSVIAGDPIAPSDAGKDPIIIEHPPGVRVRLQEGQELPSRGVLLVPVEDLAPQEPVPTYDLWTQVPPGVYGKCARCGHVFTIGHTSRITWEVPGLIAPVCPVGEGCHG